LLDDFSFVRFREKMMPTSAIGRSLTEKAGG
jgi:hypothetical protein